ncbi:hypothetical protein O1611_g9005 [Lasiodiplodia mahajangana]|uniref:Uncharacterized protein n=1 Tax=Lasiodiplodia mahajangana TaxID=1108764 RepID=A0ACC2JB44_9PEZI|nr:hypothetical protein O1611_g9005 [Lasiodiplodia mahajangana]
MFHNRAYRVRSTTAKKQPTLATDPRQGHRSFVPHSSLDPDTPMDGSEQQEHQVIYGDAEIDDASAHTLAQGQRKMEKQRRKEERRAAKRAKQEQEQQQEQQLVSRLENVEEPNHLAEILDSQEHMIAARRQRVEEAPPEAYTNEPAKVQNTSSKKRKRRSRNPADDTSERSPKKSKSPSSRKDGIAAEQDKLARDDVIEGPEESSNGGINFKDLAEQHYRRRKKDKRKSHHDALVDESGLSTETGLGPGEHSRILETDDQMEADLSRNGLGGHEAPNRIEVHQGGDADHVYDSDNSDNMASRAISTGHIITADQFSSSARDSSNDGNTALGYVEIPSSVPRPGSTDGPGAIRSATNRTSTGRKRVVKPDFFSRIVDEVGESINQSPSTAALLRREKKGKEKLVPSSEYETRTSPPSTNGKPRRSKATNMLDGDVSMTPPTSSVNRTQTPTTPVTLSGAFSELEIRNLSRAVERFRDGHNMTQPQVNELIHSNPKGQSAVEFWGSIVATCPGRSRRQVMDQTRRRFHNFVARGTWTAEQDQELRQMYEQYGNKYAMIGQAINRHPEDIRDRIRNYIICGDNQNKNRWSQEEVDQLIEIVEEATAEIRRERDMRGQDDNLPVEEDINWQMVSQSMGRTRSRLQCIVKWKAIKAKLNGDGLDGETLSVEEIVQQAWDTATTISYRNRRIIIQEILKSSVNTDSRIPWLTIRRELGESECKGDLHPSSATIPVDPQARVS